MPRISKREILLKEYEAVVKLALMKKTVEYSSRVGNFQVFSICVLSFMSNMGQQLAASKALFGD